MTARFEIIEARPWHCGQIVRCLRSEHYRAIVCMGLDHGLHRELKARFDASFYRKAWLINGELAGLGGLTGSVMETESYIWLALTDVARGYPREMVREGRLQIETMMATKRRLLTTLLPDDESAKRFAVFLGFEPCVYSGGPAWSKSSRETMKAELDHPDNRVPMGLGYGLAMQISREAA